MKNEVIAVIPTLVITFQKSHLRDLSEEERATLKNLVERPLSDEEILITYLENIYWKKYKHVMVKNTVRSKQNLSKIKKNEFRGTHLRFAPIDKYHNFLIKHGCYVKSGAGITFPKQVGEKAKEKIERKEDRYIAFGSTVRMSKEERSARVKGVIAKVAKKKREERKSSRRKPEVVPIRMS